MIRTKQGIIKRYNSILSKFYKGRNELWDMPTLNVCYPQIALKLRILKRLYNVLPDRNK